MAVVALLESPLFLSVAAVALVVLFGLIYYFVFSSSGSSEEKTPLLGKKKRHGPPFGVPRDSGKFRVYRSAESPDQLLQTHSGVNTVSEAFKKCVQVNADRPCLGTRVLERVDKVTDKETGRVLEKVTLGAYQWKTYREVANIVENLGAGLTHLGHRPGQRIAIWCETSAVWQMSAQSAFSRSFPVVTVYDSLGADAAQLAFEEAEVETVIVDSKKISTLKGGKMLPPVVKRVVFVGELDEMDSKSFTLPLLSWDQVVEAGAQHPSAASPPTPDAIAVVMYTSGTTSKPKGVLISHRNLVAVQAAVREAIPSITNNDVYLGYLPLAHVLELSAETTFLSIGVPIGYGSPLTLTDASPKIQRGTRGDCSELRPTLMAAVPAIMDRIRRAVHDKVSKGSWLKQKLFHWAYARKEAAYKAGRRTPLLDKFVFSAIARMMGGRMRMLISGGAPLATETELFMNICFCCKVGQGYGLTETCGMATIVREDDRNVGHVGAPVPCAEIRLIDWPEGNYTSSDKPYPRGEIAIGGANVTMGYLKMEEKTAESFVVVGGQRWFLSGDIGMVRDDGTIQIVDRKKDLVKLSHGEYLSLGMIESSIAKSPLIENCCVYADSYHDYCIAIVVPNLAKLAAAINHPNADASVCSVPEAKAELLKSINEAAKSQKLSRPETPKNIIISSEPWTPESGLVTAALKLKRETITAAFKSQIAKEYI